MAHDSRKRRPPRPTPRQERVLQLLSEGCRNKEIARDLGITEAGAKKHIEALMRRYSATNRAQIVGRAMAAGHLELAAGSDSQPGREGPQS